MTEHIYLLQEREFINTGQKIYKPGRTKQEDNNRFKGYPKGSNILVLLTCSNCEMFERMIKILFKKKYKQCTEIGTEYFKGDWMKMRDDMYTLVSLIDNKHFQINKNLISPTMRVFKQLYNKILQRNNLISPNMDVFKQLYNKIVQLNNLIDNFIKEYCFISKNKHDRILKPQLTELFETFKLSYKCHNIVSAEILKDFLKKKNVHIIKSNGSEYFTGIKYVVGFAPLDADKALRLESDEESIESANKLVEKNGYTIEDVELSINLEIKLKELSTGFLIKLVQSDCIDNKQFNIINKYVDSLYDHDHLYFILKLLKSSLMSKKKINMAIISKKIKKFNIAKDLLPPIKTTVGPKENHRLKMQFLSLQVHLHRY